MTTTEATLLAGIVANPREYDRWLVLADWLEDQGDPRSELARLRWLLHAEPDHPEAAGRAARQAALLDAGLAPVVSTFTNGIGMEFGLVLPGTFWMGSPEQEAGHNSEEVLHRATLTEPFFLGLYPVTVGEFRNFAEASGYRTEAERSDGAYGLRNDGWQKDASIHWRNPLFEQGDRHPVVCLSWNDAEALTAWLNEAEPRPGWKCALPSEAQWEHACRAGTTTTFFWGDDVADFQKRAWCDANSGNRAHPVDSLAPNAWGFWHLHGLVWEWCADWLLTPTRTARPAGQRVPNGSTRVQRGGGWRSVPASCRSARRVGTNPADRFSHYGFRLALVPTRARRARRR